jgi:hypothetical protein
LNPILSYFSLIALALTLREQRKLAVESAKKEVLQEMQRVLAGACNALDEYLAVPIDEGDEQDEHLRTNVRDMCANLVQSASTMGDSGHFGPAVPNHLRKNPVIGRSALQFQRVTSICGAYLKEGGTVKVVRLYMSAYMNEAGMFHALFEAPIQLRYFDEYGLHPFRLRAETLAKKFAEADASYKELQASEKDLNEALERRNKWVPDAGESH